VPTQISKSKLPHLKEEGQSYLTCSSSRHPLYCSHSVEFRGLNVTYLLLIFATHFKWICLSSFVIGFGLGFFYHSRKRPVPDPMQRGQYAFISLSLTGSTYLTAILLIPFQKTMFTAPYSASAIALLILFLNFAIMFLLAPVARMRAFDCWRSPNLAWLALVPLLNFGLFFAKSRTKEKTHPHGRLAEIPDGATGVILGLMVMGASLAALTFVLAIWQTTLATDKGKGLLAETFVGNLKSRMSLPQKIDEVTTLENVKAEGFVVRYEYTVVGNGETADIRYFFLTNSLPKLCNAVWKQAIDAGIQFRLTYTRAQSGVLLMDQTINKWSCSDTGFREALGESIGAEMKKLLPMKIDMSTTMTNVTSTNEGVTYHVLVSQIVKTKVVENIASEKEKKFDHEMACQPAILQLLSHGGYLAIDYKSDDDDELGIVKFIKGDCDRPT